MALALSFLVPFAAFAQQSTTQTQSSPSQQQAPVTGQPSMPPINRDQLPENPAPSITPVQPQPQPAPSVQSGAIQTEPSGTAAAEAQKPVGNAGSQPAGAAIAPPKQRQIRSFLIKFGAIAGAGIALGTVYALSTASPSRVPGSPGH